MSELEHYFTDDAARGCGQTEFEHFIIHISSAPISSRLSPNQWKRLLEFSLFAGEGEHGNAQQEEISIFLQENKP